MANQVVWVDIPVIDLNRAITSISCSFWTAWWNGNSSRGTEFAVLPHAHDSVSGCLFKKSDDAPSGTGISWCISVAKEGSTRRRRRRW